MKRLLPHPLPGTPDALMTKAGYVRHCVEAGRACYHRRLNDPRFPRFHAYISMNDQGMEIDLHFDALDSINHKSNHDQPWAYTGGRVDEEMQRLLQAMAGIGCLKQIYHPPDPSGPNSGVLTKKKLSLFDLLFKSM